MKQIARMQLFAFATLLLVTSVNAEDGLAGTWVLVDEEAEEIGVSLFLTISADGTMEFKYDMKFGPELIASDYGGEEDEPVPDIPFFTEGFNMGLVLTGGWEVTDTQLTFTATKVSMDLNGRSVEEFFVGLVNDIIAALAEEEGLSEEDGELIALEESLLEEFSAEAAKEFEEDMISEFSEALVTEFSVTGDTLILTHDDDVVEKYVRWAPASASAVSATSWGQLKAAVR